MIDFSWVMLTWNRIEKTRRSLLHNMELSGHSVRELIWVDNGSTDGTHQFMDEFSPSVQVRFHRNRGTARGFNTGLRLATREYILIMGSDIVMPPGWLAKIADAVERLPNLGVLSIYDRITPPERRRGDVRSVQGVIVQPAMPMSVTVFKRDLLTKFGYFREDFGLYGFDDLYWGYHAEQVCRKEGLHCYTLPELQFFHMGSEGAVEYKEGDDREYWEFKRKQVTDSRGPAAIQKGFKEGFEYFNPFGEKR